jgi:putative FmdB family regulatory protein
MPLYEYRCRGCGERFEVLQRLGQDGEALSCPRCAEPRPERQLSTFAAATGGRTGDTAGGCADMPPGSCCGGGFCAN